MSVLPVIYSRSPNLGSALIRAASWWGPWSHVGILDGDLVIEATAWHGVVATPLDAFKARASAFKAVDIACPQPHAALAFARAQLGKPYDWGAILGFPLREPLDNPEKWFCSELVEAALVAGGRERFRQPPWRIMPVTSFNVT